VAVGRYTAQSNPVNAVITTGQMNYFAAPNQMTQTLNGQSITVVGSNQPHDNMMPYLGLNWCIALQGVFPTRS
jgi:microcystin-dependent protein